MLSRSQELTDALATNVILAREYLKDVVITPDQVGGGGWVGRWVGVQARGRKGGAAKGMLGQANQQLPVAVVYGGKMHSFAAQ